MIYSVFSNKETFIAGKTLPPADVEGFTAVPSTTAGGVSLSWDPIADIDIQAYIIQYGTSTVWGHADNIEIFRGLTTDFLYVPETAVPLNSKYLIRAVDTLGTESINFTSTSITLVTPEWDINYCSQGGFKEYDVLEGDCAPADWHTALQKLEHTIEGSSSTLKWPIPIYKSFNIKGYQVKFQDVSEDPFDWNTAEYLVGEDRLADSGLVNIGLTDTEDGYLLDNTWTGETTWGSGGNPYGYCDIGGEADYSISESDCTGTWKYTPEGRVFGIKALDIMGHSSSNPILFTVNISEPSNNFTFKQKFEPNSEGTKADVHISWDSLKVGMVGEDTSHFHWLPIDYYIIEYEGFNDESSRPEYVPKDWRVVASTNIKTAFSELHDTSFFQEVDWGPSITNTGGYIEGDSGTSNAWRRYWITPVDTAGNKGKPAVWDVEVIRPNKLEGLENSNYHTKSSNGVVDITWDVPTMTSAPITSIKIYWEKPVVEAGTNIITTTLKNSKAGAATKYSTPVTWGPTAIQIDENGDDYTASTKDIYFVCKDSAGNLSIPVKYSITVGAPEQIDNIYSSIIDNNIILSWDTQVATSGHLPITSFNLYRCPASGTCTEGNYRTSAQLVSNLGNTHTYTFFETTAGIYSYFIEAQDTAGNFGVGKIKSAPVREPRDFVLLNEVFSKFDPSALTTGYCSGYFLDSNASNLNEWPFTIGTGNQVIGGLTEYNRQSSADENVRSVEIDAYGNESVVWRAINKGVGDIDNGDGGFNSHKFDIDHTKTYRVSYWLNSKDSNTNGRRYTGLNVYNSSSVEESVEHTSSSTRTNPYFWYGDVEEVDTWYLMVGFIKGSGSGTITKHSDHGMYKVDGTEISDITVDGGSWDYKFNATSTQMRVRGYQYYNPDYGNQDGVCTQPNGTVTNITKTACTALDALATWTQMEGTNDEVWFMPPRVDDISDANCPTIEDLLHARQYTDARAEGLCESNSGDWIESSEAYWDNIVTISDTQALAPIDATHTWEQHFNNSQHGDWGTIQDQIDAGFEFYVVPEGTAHYWQKWDMGTEIPQALITYLETHEDYRSTHQNVSPEIEYTPTLYYTNNETVFDSEADITNIDPNDWTSGLTNEISILANDFRYVKVHVEYSADNGSFRKILSQSLSLGLSTIRDDSKKEVLITEDDAATGVEVLFNKTFRDINSIIITPKYIAGSCLLGDGSRDYSITNSSDCSMAGGTFRVGNKFNNQNTAIYDFVDVANPTSFIVYLLDANSGAFSDGKFTWQVTGV